MPENDRAALRSVSPPVTALRNFESPLSVRPENGDLIEIDRKLYSHWAVYIGDGNVIHVSGRTSDIPTDGNACVQVSKLSTMAGSCLVRVNNKLVPAKERGLQTLPWESVVENARKQMGQVFPYDVFSKNSEHYVTLWKYGRGWSDQADTARSVMSMFHKRKTPCLGYTRRSAPSGNLRDIVTELAAIFNPKGAGTPTSGRLSNYNLRRRQSNLQ